MHASSLLSELIVVREWLHKTAPPPQHPEVTTGYWKFTKHNVMQGLRTTAGPRDGLVKELDPDAIKEATVALLLPMMRYTVRRVWKPMS